jgi:hypothetical protein
VGTIKPARIEIMATTIRISMRVKPHRRGTEEERPKGTKFLEYFDFMTFRYSTYEFDKLP